MPSAPSTLAISCGSQIAVVTPRGENAAVEFMSGVTSEDSMCRCVSMKPGTIDSSGHVDLTPAGIGAERADDAVLADRDICLDQLARDEVEDAASPENDVGRFVPGALIDHAFQPAGHRSFPVMCLDANLAGIAAGQRTGGQGGGRGPAAP